MIKRYRLNLIRTRRSYSLAEIAGIYKIHIRTVQDWTKCGLNVLDKTTKPHLVIGAEVKRFLKSSSQKRKHHLLSGEFFCPKCRSPRRSFVKAIKYMRTNKKLGPDSQQVIIKGKCRVCNTILTLFTSDKKLTENNKRDYLGMKRVPLRLT